MTLADQDCFALKLGEGNFKLDNPENMDIVFNHWLTLVQNKQCTLHQAIS